MNSHMDDDLLFGFDMDMKKGKEENKDNVLNVVGSLTEISAYVAFGVALIFLFFAIVNIH